MLNSILLCLDDTMVSRAVIEVGVSIARPRKSRVRGVTLVDSRDFQSLSSICGSAAQLLSEQTHLRETELRMRPVHTGLSEACIAAGLNFDIRQLSGDPLQLLAAEARYQDLVVIPSPDGATTWSSGQTCVFSHNDIVGLLDRSVQPMLVLRKEARSFRRVLLTYDGSGASGKSIRSYFRRNLFPGAETRLLAVGDNEAEARRRLDEMSDYIHAHGSRTELGFLCGSLRRQLAGYANKWGADLIVLGVDRGNVLLRRLSGNVIRDVLTDTASGVFASC